MIARIGRRLKNLVHPSKVTCPPAVSKATYFEKGNQWYQPSLAGPSTFLSEVTGAGPVCNASAILERLTPDRYMDFVLRFYRQGLERFGDHWVYADINTVLLGLSRVLQPKSYLEIGVRRGRSIAMVASQARDCHIVAFDLWIENYAGMENPGKEFVRQELGRVGFSGNIEFFDGDSRETVPRYFREHPDKYFDMITVDGDHSLKGARKDLLNVIPRVKVGGVLVFDDISNQSFPHLEKLWNMLVVGDPRFTTYSFEEVGFGIAFAIRRY